MTNYLTGDYSSLAELAGEAPPPMPEFDAEFFDGYCDDPDMAFEVMDIVNEKAKRDRESWFRRNSDNSPGYDEGYRQALIDHGIDTQD